MSDVFRLLEQFDHVIDAHTHALHHATSLKQENERLRVIIAAIWEVMKDHCGALDEELERKLTALLKRASGAAAPPAAAPAAAAPAKKGTGKWKKGARISRRRR